MSHQTETLAARIGARQSTVGIIGLGYVGLPLAVAAAEGGYPVVGFDIDTSKIIKIEDGESYIEAVASADLSRLVEDGRLKVTTEFSHLSECDVIVICVPTPLSRQREPDLRFVETTAREIAQHMTSRTLVVLESTTFPGTTEEILVPLLASGGLAEGTDFFVGFSPEREDPGNAKFQTRNIPKVVSGKGAKAAAMVSAFYENVVESVVAVSTPRTAEAVKITENIFRAVNIALVNELKLIYDAMDIDIWEVIDAAATKPFGFMPFYPGPGLGGHCIPIDPFYLTWKAREFDVPTRFIELAGEINTRMPSHIVDRTREVIDRTTGRGLRGARILLVGISYKKNVGDMRESPSMRLMRLLEDAGATVDYLDPMVPEIPGTREYPEFSGRTAIDEAEIAGGNFDAILISTDHDQIDYSALLDAGCPIIDTRNAIARRGLAMDKVTKA